MSRHLLPGLLVLSLLSGAAAPQAASDPRSVSDHPYVGLAVFAAGGSMSHTCSGALLGPRVFLTSGQCTAGMEDALIWLDTAGEFDPSTGVPGQPVTHPAFDDFSGYPNSSDLGVVLLEEPIDLPVYAQLPAVGTFDNVGTGLGGPFTSVGFSLEAVVPFMQEAYIRVAVQPYAVDLGTPPTDGFHLNLLPVAARSSGDAMCVGARGRPAFIGSTTVLAGIASVVSTSGCTGAAFYFRLDTPFAQEFVRGFLQ